VAFLLTDKERNENMWKELQAIYVIIMIKDYRQNGGNM